MAQKVAPPTATTTPATSARHPTPKMIYRRLGRTGLDVSLLSLGSWVTFDWQLDTDAAKNVISAAYDAGINFFDNAEAYAYGKSEVIMGQALKDLALPRENIVVSTKVFHGSSQNPAPTARGLSRKHIIEGVKASLSRLQLDYVDIVYAHRPDPTVPMEEIVRSFNWVINQGWAFYWGTSEWPSDVIEEACHVAHQLHLIPPSLEQPQYSLLHRKRVEIDLKDVIENRGLGVTTYSPLACGLLTGKYNNKRSSTTSSTNSIADGTDGTSEVSLSLASPVRTGGTRFEVERYQFLANRWLTPEKLAAAEGILPIAASLGATPAQLALAFCAANPAVSSVLTGATKVEQLMDNLGALQIVDKITPEVVQQIERAVGGGKELDLGK